MMSETRGATIAMVVFPGMKLLDLIGPLDVFGAVPGAKPILVGATKDRDPAVPGRGRLVGAVRDVSLHGFARARRCGFVTRLSREHALELSQSFQFIVLLFISGLRGGLISEESARRERRST
jgi:hypothetical protein